ncbi:hypothetical protein E2C01_038925 [Portunus trituberculatus]|uniref:Uncharacterized protein n=1 Tax=Portunus trituberculatus TaxID=210409 RepID=A0A5B7FFG2_PORTR|nr:hypothetical protein [Portunus trituberculatus]
MKCSVGDFRYLECHNPELVAGAAAHTRHQARQHHHHQHHQHQHTTSHSRVYKRRVATPKDAGAAVGPAAATASCHKGSTRGTSTSPRRTPGTVTLSAEWSRGRLWELVPRVPEGVGVERQTDSF